MSSMEGLGRALDDFGLEGDAPTSGVWGTAGVGEGGGGQVVDWSMVADIMRRRSCLERMTMTTQ